ncbi:MAG: helix-turn-helix domain-containing protein [Pseudomonadota bacterium]
MAQAKPTDNVVSFPGASDEDGTTRSETNCADPGTPSPDFGALGEDWPTLSPAERAARLFERRADGGTAVPVGALIQAVRQAQGLSVDQVATQLKFDRTVITGIEAMDLGAMPKGFRGPRIKTYARALHLPADDILAIYRTESPDLDAVAPRPEIQAMQIDPAQAQHPKWALPAAVAGGLALCLAGFQVLTSGGPETNTPSIAADQTAPRTELPPFDSAAAAMQGDYTAIPLTLVAVRKGWIEVRGANGTLFRDREMRSGEVYFPRIGAGWTVSARDGGAFEWRVGDVVVGPLGTSETSVYAESVDLVARDALKSVAPTLAASDAISPRH